MHPQRAALQLSGHCAAPQIRSNRYPLAQSHLHHTAMELPHVDLPATPEKKRSGVLQPRMAQQFQHQPVAFARQVIKGGVKNDVIFLGCTTVRCADVFIVKDGLVCEIQSYVKGKRGASEAA